MRRLVVTTQFTDRSGPLERLPKALQKPRSITFVELGLGGAVDLSELVLPQHPRGRGGAAGFVFLDLADTRISP